MGSWYSWPDPKLGSSYNTNLLFSERITQGFCPITVHRTPRWGCVTTWICKYWWGPNIVDLTPSWGPVGDPRIGFYWSSTDPTFGLYCRLLSHHPILGLLICLLACLLPGDQTVLPYHTKDRVKAGKMSKTPSGGGNLKITAEGRGALKKKMGEEYVPH